MKTLALVLHLVVLLLLLPAPQRAARAEPPPSPPIVVRFDDSAVRGLLDLIAAKDTTDASLERWLDLPANQNLLRVGAREGSLTRAQLKESALAVIEGRATPANQPPHDPARLLVTRPEVYRRMLDDLRNSADARTRVIGARVGAFCPEDVAKETVTATVYLHLGGTWDALNVQGDIYLNMHYWHDYHRPGWDGLNMIVAHEAMHTVQNRAYGNPEDQASGEGAFLSALSKIQREGTARLVEVETDPGPYEEFSYGFYYRAVDYERIRDFPATVSLLGPLTASAFPTFNRPRFAQVYATGMDSGGPFYTLGHGIARAIDEKMGRKALVETVTRGPKDFFLKYVQLCERDPSLPRLPEATVERLRAMKERL
jgi:hypothetical protein